jgi:hypothetical protein
VFSGWKNKPLTHEAWLEITSNGCDHCGEIPNLSDADDLHWYANEGFFCNRCYNSEAVQHYLSLEISQQEMFV